MVNVVATVTAVLENKYFEVVFGQNRAEHRNRGNDITVYKLTEFIVT